MHNIDFSLPFEEPVLVFAIILFIILFAPLLLNKLKIPAIIGLILAGVIIGPNGFNLLARNSSIELFGTVGILYIMFLAGLEIDLNEFKRNRKKGVTFGFITVLIPVVISLPVFYFGFKYSLNAAVLISAILVSHTLITYPLVSKLGISKNLAVNISIAGTLIADVTALLILAVDINNLSSDIGFFFWIRFFVSVIVFFVIVFYLFPYITRLFFKKYSDNIMQYIFVLLLVFLAAFLAKSAGLEPIIGAFIAGLALNRFIPHTSPLMTRIEFIGNAIFIPFFIIGVGMLINYEIIFKSFDALIIILVMSVIAIGSKYLAAIITKKLFKLSKNQGLLIFGLSNSRVAAALAISLIGFNFILGQTDDGQVIRLLDENIFNAVVILILITSTISSFATQKAGLKIAKDDLQNTIFEDYLDTENTLVGLANEATVEDLIELSISTINKKRSKEIYGLHIITADKENNETKNKALKLINNAEKYAASADFKLNPLIRYDINIASGIINTIKEKNIKHFYIGLHNKTSLVDTFFGNLTNELLTKNNSSIYIYKSCQPLNTIKKYVLVIPPNAELELGFCEWYYRIAQIAENTGNKFNIFANDETLTYIEKSKINSKNFILSLFENFDDFLVISREIVDNTMLIVNLARKDGISYNPFMDKIPAFLQKYFKNVSFILVYPNRINNYSEGTNPYSNPSIDTNFLK